MHQNKNDGVESMKYIYLIKIWTNLYKTFRLQQNLVQIWTNIGKTF